MTMRPPILLLFLSRFFQVLVPSGKYQRPWPTAPGPEYNLNKVQSQTTPLTVGIGDSKYMCVTVCVYV